MVELTIVEKYNNDDEHSILSSTINLVSTVFRGSLGRIGRVPAIVSDTTLMMT